MVTDVPLRIRTGYNIIGICDFLRRVLPDELSGKTCDDRAE